MNAAPVVLAILLLGGCSKAPDAEQKTTTTTTTTESSTTRDKTTVEKAFDAGMRARQKAEVIKAEEDRKVKETNTAGNE